MAIANRSNAESRSATTAQPASAEPKGNGRFHVNPEELNRMISEAAYYRAERRGFAGGAELEDWFAAEEEIKQLAAAAT